MMGYLAQLLMADPQSALVVAAHPDDETIGAAGLMGRVQRCHVFHVTDGAPHDPRFWTADVRTRGEYVRIRRDELARALSLVGIDPRFASSLGVADLEAAMALGAIAQRVSDLILQCKPSLVVTHAYEGGHPDHDAASFGVWAATHMVARQKITPPPIVEMALYHGGPGHAVFGRFLPGSSAEPEIEPEIEIVLSEDEKWRKQAMLDCFGSQAMTLMSFRPLGVERYRLAPEYDFTQPPHPGPLLYEQRNFPITGAAWREQAKNAMRALDLVDDKGKLRASIKKSGGGAHAGVNPGQPRADEAQS